MIQPERFKIPGSKESQIWRSTVYPWKVLVDCGSQWLLNGCSCFFWRRFAFRPPLPTRLLRYFLKHLPHPGPFTPPAVPDGEAPSSWAEPPSSWAELWRPLPGESASLSLSLGLGGRPHRRRSLTGRPNPSCGFGSEDEDSGLLGDVVLTGCLAWETPELPN